VPKHCCPGTQQGEIGRAFEKKHAWRIHRLHQIGVGENTQCPPQARAIFTIGNASRLMHHQEKAIRVDAVDDDLGMGGDHQLAALSGSNRAQFAIDGVLQNDMEMRVRFVQ
jgi:hypothetical protein